jgi:hypothetical protein
MYAALRHVKEICAMNGTVMVLLLLLNLIFSEVCVEGTTDKPGPAQNMNIQITPTSQLNHGDFNKIGWFWYEGYKGIKYANVVIDRIDDATYTKMKQKETPYWVLLIFTGLTAITG